MMGNFRNPVKRAQNAHNSNGSHVCGPRKMLKRWLRGVDLNHRPLGYEPNELPDCSTPQFDHNNRWRDRQTYGRFGASNLRSRSEVFFEEAQRGALVSLQEPEARTPETVASNRAARHPTVVIGIAPNRLCGSRSLFVRTRRFSDAKERSHAPSNHYQCAAPDSSARCGNSGLWHRLTCLAS